jgi:hypothetical protein
MGGMQTLHQRLSGPLRTTVQDYNIRMATKPHEIVSEPAPETPVKPFSEMTEAEYEAWDRDFIAALWAGDDSASKASLAAGVPIYYREEDTPTPGVIKEYPDGRRELVTFTSGVEQFLRKL